ncbi:MAG: glycosyltransferase, partial [Anaerolineales bacterium]|nr:glycosyltransferase [Anaerolineales bacterium]
VPEQFQMPLSVLVGEGDTAVPVSLDRFQPLGRVDFTIDFPEFAAAINQAAQRSAATSCARGEQLQNGNFANWHTVGESFGPLQEVALLAGDGVITFNVAPNGEWAFGSGEDGTGGVISLPLEQILAMGLPGPASPQHVAISGDSQRIFVLGDDDGAPRRLAVIEATTFEPLGNPLFVPRSSCMALSPNGRALYIAMFARESARGEVWAVDTALLTQALADNADFDLSDVLVSGDPTLFPNPIPLAADALPASMVVSPDGRRLFVAAAQVNTLAGDVYAFDTATHQPLLALPLPVGNDPRDMALTVDGRRLLVANAGDDTVTLLDAARLREDSLIHLAAPSGQMLQPTSVVIEPNGRRAFVAGRNTATVSVIDLNTLVVRSPVPVGAPDFGEIDLAVTPAGDRLYVALQNPYPTTVSGLRFLPLGRQLPDNWMLTTGFVRPVPFADPFGVTAVLGPLTREERDTQPARPSALSQSVAAVGGCTYDFSFWGLTNSLEAVAEVIWRGGACAIERTDTIPIQMPDIERQRAVRETAAFRGANALDPAGNLMDTRAMTMNVRAAVARELPELLFHRARLQAPPGATQAEIRFLVPPQHIAVVDTVSLQATSDTLANGDLLLVADGALAGWQLAPASVTGVTVNAADDGVELANLERVPISLRQSFDVTGGQPFTLLLRGEIVSQLSGGAPQVALDWLAADGRAAGASRLTIASGQSAHSLEGSVPVGAASAALSLVLPPGTTLRVRQISFVPVELVTVPIRFLAQAPGNLTVTGFDVAYEVGEVATTPPPADGLCAATPPGRSAAGAGGCCQWCSSPCGPCGDEGGDGGEAVVAAVRPLPATAPRRRATIAARPVLVNRPVAVSVAAPPEIVGVETAVAPLLTASAVEWAERAPQLAAASVSMAAISGIASERVRLLANMGIDNIPRLAATAPEALDGLRGVSLGMARRFVADAQTIAANVADLPAPLVSCIMPTFNRRQFVPLAIAYFLRQDYPNRELIVLDDGEDAVGDLVPDDERIRYVRLDERMSIGAKRNRGGAEARGPILASWDDDVWMAPWRLSYQVGALTEYEADVVGLDNVLHYDPFARRGWHSVRPSGRLPWMPGSTFCYTREFWQANPFPDVQPGEDIRFLRQKSEAKIVTLQAITWLVDIIHEANASPKPTDSPLWFPYDVAEIVKLLGDDAVVYAEMGRGM